MLQRVENSHLWGCREIEGMAGCADEYWPPTSARHLRSNITVEVFRPQVTAIMLHVRKYFTLTKNSDDEILQYNNMCVLQGVEARSWCKKKCKSSDARPSSSNFYLLIDCLVPKDRRCTLSLLRGPGTRIQTVVFYHLHRIC